MKRVALMVLLLVTVGAVAQSRRVEIYPLTSDYHEFTFRRSGTSYTGAEIRAVVVLADQMDKLYSVHCTMMKRWNHCQSLPDNAYWVDINGHSMKIWAQWEGNQHKGYSDNFTIDDIRQLDPAFKSVQDIDAFKKSDAFQQLIGKSRTSSK